MNSIRLLTKKIPIFATMSPTEAKDQIQALTAELRQHTYNYYVLAMPTISDYDFDKKLEQLSELEKQFPEFADPDSPTQSGWGRYHQGVCNGKAPLAHAIIREYL
jgi:DNA ligase (NAD+)